MVPSQRCSGRLLQISSPKRFPLNLAGLLGLVVGSAVWSGGSCRADFVVQTLDQSYVADVSSGYRAYCIWEGHRYAQTFQVGIAGTLSQVGLQVEKSAATVEEANQITEPLMLSIMSVAANGSPGSVTLGTFAIAPSAVPTFAGFTPQFVPVDVSSAGIAVQTGQSLALVLTSALPPPPEPLTTVPTYGFITTPEDGYAAGGGWGRPPGYGWGSLSFDFGFQTYVTPVPEPGMLSLFAVGIVPALRRLSATAKRSR